MPSRLHKLLLLFLMLVAASLQSCAAGAASARAQAIIGSNDEPEFLAAIKQRQDSGNKVACMILPENISVRGGDTDILNVFLAAGLRVINAMDSMDQKTLLKYKKGLESQNFKIDDADKDKFNGVDYIVIYRRDWKWQPEFPNLLHFTSKIEMKLWWVRNGLLVATLTSEGDYNSYGDYSGQSAKLTEALCQQRLPGTKPIEATGTSEASATKPADGAPAPAPK